MWIILLPNCLCECVRGVSKRAVIEQVLNQFDGHRYLSVSLSESGEVTDIADCFFDTYNNVPGFTVCTGYPDNFCDVQPVLF